MLVSLIIPARDAAATIAETLESALAQTAAEWEAVVVDDGSADATAGIAAGFAERDERIRLVRGPGEGAGAARNRGLESARGEYVLFLDADDRLVPEALAKLRAPLAARPQPDGVFCGWTRVSPQGETWDSLAPPGTAADPAAVFARTCAFSIHACLVRRSLVVRAGGFDPSLRTCEDWDLWLRIARAGARLVEVPEYLAVYRMRPDSASVDAVQVLRDGAEVIRRAGGSGVSDTLLGWTAGIALGRGEDPAALLDLAGARPGGADPTLLANGLATGIAVGRATVPRHLIELPEPLEAAGRFLERVEERAGGDRLAERARRRLAREVLAAATPPAAFGGMAALAVAVDEPLEDVVAPDGTDTLLVSAGLAGAPPLGQVELPVVDGVVPAPVLADAIAAELAWPILGRHLARTAYAGLPAAEAASRHDEDGWWAFLTELFGHPAGGRGALYSGGPAGGEPEEHDGARRWEVGTPLPDVRARGPLAVVPAVGGAALGVVPAGGPGDVHAGAIRSQVLLRTGFELARAVVRELLIGRPFDGTPLRERAAAQPAGLQPWAPPPAEPGPLVPRRHPLAIGAGASRRARLPAAAAASVRRAAAARGEAVPGEGATLRYEPGLLPEPIPLTEPARPPAPPAAAPAADRQFFERLFATRPDPWAYGSPYEQRKYEQTLSLLPAGPIHSALELACAEGHFTRQLAPRVGRLVAADISALALERAAEACAGLPNVEFRRLDLFAEPIPGRYDLVTCSEVLYYVGDERDLERVARSVAAAVAPGGTLLSAHAHVVADAPGEPGFDWGLPFGVRTIGRALAAAPGMRLEEELVTPYYRVQRFTRRARPRLPRRPVRRAVEADERMTDDVRSSFSRDGAPVARPAPAGRDRLLVLMYHRVADSGDERMRRWRVAVDDFKRQVDHLVSAGFACVTLDEWRDAAAANRAFPRRPLAITFDDGYADFAEHAWPVLEDAGLQATVFLPTAHVGRTNAWDAGAERVALMGWDTIAELERRGVAFGSHSATHPPLSALSWADLVTELSDSRAELGERLRRPTDAVAYPYGDFSPAVEHLAAGAGYLYGLTCSEGTAGFQDRLTALPRVEVRGTAGFAAFVRSLGA